MDLSRALWLHKQHRVRTLRHYRTRQIANGYTRQWQKLVFNSIYGSMISASRGTGKSLINQNWLCVNALLPGGSSINYPATTIRFLTSRVDFASTFYVSKEIFRRQVLGMKPKIAMKQASAKLP